ncbi:MAG: hypothetical protein P8N43_14815, partial [Alphaproteobacteria bacterium]|nr:hypothetical protein [Alphaproteobacteria bacterium]
MEYSSTKKPTVAYLLKKLDSMELPPKGRITKASVQADMTKFLMAEFPDVEIPEEKIKEYALLHLVTGLDPKVLDRVKELEQQRQSGQ